MNIVRTSIFDNHDEMIRTSGTCKRRNETYAAIIKKNTKLQSSEFRNVKMFPDSNTNLYTPKTNNNISNPKQQINQIDKQSISSTKNISCSIHNKPLGTNKTHEGISYNNSAKPKIIKLWNSANKIHTELIQTQTIKRTDLNLIPKLKPNIRINIHNNINV